VLAKLSRDDHVKLGLQEADHSRGSRPCDESCRNLS